MENMETFPPKTSTPLESEKSLLAALELLDNGGRLYYAPHSKRVKLVQENQPVPFDPGIFTQLQASGLIRVERAGVMMRSEMGFTGIVDVYEISDEGKEALTNGGTYKETEPGLSQDGMASTEASVSAIEDSVGEQQRSRLEVSEHILRDPDHNFPVPPEFKDISRDEVLGVAHDAGMRVMRQIRERRDAIIVGKEHVSFPLPVLHEPGRLNSLISLSTTGCRYAHTGECIFCDYGKSELKRPEVIASLQGQVEKAFEQIEKENAGYLQNENGEWELVKEGGYERGFINLTAIGSMLDPREVPEEILMNVCDRIALMVTSGKFPKGLEWTTESRLELVNEDVLQKIQAAFSRHGIEIGSDQFQMDIGYGLESSDPLIVEGIMYKRVGRPYEDSAALMHEYGIKSTAHTLFKPPFLTEREAVEDAVKTVQEAFERKLCDTMIVMTMNIRDATGVGEMAEQGMYQLPSIWSVAEIIKRLGPELCRKSHFFGFSVATEKAGTVTPKDTEEQKLMGLILGFAGEPEQWNEIVTFLDSASGNEKKQWEVLMRNTSQFSLASRIATGLDLMGKKYLGKGYHELAEDARKLQARKAVQASTASLPV
jgi:radical SAM enzyme (TIGR01210 family)